MWAGYGSVSARSRGGGRFSFGRDDAILGSMTDRAPLGEIETYRGFRSAMLSRPRALFAWLGRRLFDHVNLDPAVTERVRALPEEGQVVYVMRTRSLLDYLFFNHLFLKVGLPLARFANGVDLSFFRGLGEFFGNLWRRGEQPAALDQLESTITRGQSALLFMKVRALTAERVSAPGFIERLVTLQRQLDRPLLLLPQVISWPRKPPSGRRTWFDAAFGDVEAAGRFRKLAHFVLYRRVASVQVGEPIDLQQTIAEHSAWSDARIARKVRRVLFIHLAREAMAVSGPRVKPSAMIRREIVERAKFQRQLREEAERLGLGFAKAKADARKDLKEIGADFRFTVILLLGKFLDVIFNRVFRGVEVDADGMRLVKEAARNSRSAPLVLVPCHKSHLDYLVISWVFLRNEFIPPHIAAGQNLSFFPLGSVLRRGGAFFLRRSFAGQPLYKLVFRAYLWKVVREGYPIEFYMEGGRSRTGKLLPPKLGLLSMLLEGIQEGEYKDLQFVPINLSYEKVVETAAYRRELTGGKKKSESVGGVMRAGKVLRHRYGRVYVSFQQPIRLTAWLQTMGIDDLATTDDNITRDATKRLAYHLMRRIQEATVVAPSALLGAVLLSHQRRGLSGARVRELVGFLIDLLVRRQTRLSESLQLALARHKDYIAEADLKGPAEGHRARGEAVRALVDEALVLQKRLVQRVERGGEIIYQVPDKARIELDYDRNAILGILAPDALVATALRAAEGDLDREKLGQRVRDLSFWFRLEFVYRNDVSYEASFDQTLEALTADGLIAEHDGRVSAVSPLALDFLRGTLLHLVEGYWIAADALRALSHGPMEQGDWLDHAREHGEREYLEGDIRRAEAASTAVLRNAVEVFRQEKLISKTRSSGRKPTTTFALADGVSLDDIAFRRDDLGEYLVTRRDDPVPRPVRPPREIPGALTDQASSSGDEDSPSSGS